MRLLLVGLSGGEISELGVVSVSALERSSESSPYLSNTLSVESDDFVLLAMRKCSAGYDSKCFFNLYPSHSFLYPPDELSS